MLENDTVAILGLGLIGGSLARDLSQRGARVLGYDTDPAAIVEARKARAIRAAIGEDFEALRTATIVVLAVPVDVAPALLERASHFLDAAELVTDVGSTKLRIGAEASRVGVRTRFVGSHPMVGDHRAGFGVSRMGLFSGARVYLCPSPQSEPAAKTKALEMWHAVGADVRWTTPERHDGEVAFTSHMPHLVAAAIARTIEHAGHDATALGPGGRSMTRLAESSPAMWRAIVATNHEAIARALDACIVELETVRDIVGRCDQDAVVRLFTEAGAWSEPPETPSPATKRAASRAARGTDPAAAK
ncbi:MAG: prephenate dehydrogenase/arogenate dehydrogenase family protein [Gemmatimonadetes bacterium]|nr:prephenate dehydrogenase/arogenate dehydrogenase family protein [Gemmatimonadota bacterium]